MAGSAKALASRAQTELFVDKDLSAFDRYWAEPYIQHNPLLPDGLAAIRDFMTRIVPVSDMRIVRVLADGDLVAFHQRVTLPGTVMAVFDVYRVTDDRLVEHWDVMQVLTPPESDDSAFAGPVAPGHGDADATRAVVTQFVDDVLIGHAPADDRLASDIVRHGAGLRNGGTAFAAELAASRAAGDRIVACERVLAEGDWALTVCTARIGGVAWTIYDLWRVAAGHIAEQWRVAQPVPDPATMRLPHF